MGGSPLTKGAGLSEPEGGSVRRKKAPKAVRSSTWCDPPVRKNVLKLLFVLVRMYVYMAVYSALASATVITVYSLNIGLMAMVKSGFIHKTLNGNFATANLHKL